MKLKKSDRERLNLIHNPISEMTEQIRQTQEMEAELLAMTATISNDIASVTYNGLGQIVKVQVDGDVWLDDISINWVNNSVTELCSRAFMCAVHLRNERSKALFQIHEAATQIGEIKIESTII